MNLTIWIRRQFEETYLVPCVTKRRLMRELNCHKIWLSDVGSGCPKTEMLVGSDVCRKILTGQVKQLRGSLTAIDENWDGLFEDFREKKNNNT